MMGRSCAVAPLRALEVLQAGELWFRYGVMGKKIEWRYRSIGERCGLLVMVDNVKYSQQVDRAGGVLKNVNGICFVHSLAGPLVED